MSTPSIPIVPIAEGVRKMLAESQNDFEPVRTWADWDLELEKADCPRLDVCPVTSEIKIDLAARGMVRWTIPVDVALRQKFKPHQQNDKTGVVDVALVDKLTEKFCGLVALLLPNRLTSYVDGVWEGTRVLACPLVKHLQDPRQFTAVARITFRVDKSIAVSS